MWKEYAQKLMAQPTRDGQVVEVYKNLHRGLWSIRANGLVIAHRERVVLYGVTYKVSQPGRRRVLREKRKNVHAVIQGRLLTYPDHITSPPITEDDVRVVTYNPYKYETFVTADDAEPCLWSAVCDMDVHRANPVLAAGVNA